MVTMTTISIIIVIPLLWEYCTAKWCSKSEAVYSINNHRVIIVHRHSIVTDQIPHINI